MRTRRRFTAEFKAKVALEGIQGQRTIAELATRYELHPNLITQWKRQAIEKLAKVFDDKGFEVQANRDAEVAKLHAKIGQLRGGAGFREWRCAVLDDASACAAPYGRGKGTFPALMPGTNFPGRVDRKF